MMGITLFGYSIAMWFQLFSGDENDSFRKFFRLLYIACFGILLICAELRMKWTLSYFSFLEVMHSHCDFTHACMRTVYVWLPIIYHDE